MAPARDNGDFVTGLGENDSGALTVKDEDQTVTGLLARGSSQEQEFEYSYTRFTDVAEQLDEAGISFYTDPQPAGFWTRTLFSIAPLFIVLLLFLFVMRSMQGNQSNRVMSFGKSRARRMTKDQPKVTFSDVAGADEAVQELTEIKEFLEALQKFQKLGARIPKGALLPDADPVHKITIIPRGQALGVTMSLPTEDRFMMSRGQLMAQLAMMLGGRAADEIAELATELEADFVTMGRRGARADPTPRCRQRLGRGRPTGALPGLDSRGRRGDVAVDQCDRRR